MAHPPMDAHQRSYLDSFVKSGSAIMLTAMIAAESIHHQTTRDYLHSYSPPASQTSSFNDFMPSQQSDTQMSARDGLASLQTLPTKAALTPATSLSNASSQEQAFVPDRHNDARFDKQIAANPEAIARPAQSVHAASQPSPRPSPRNAQKRMANGEIKSPGTHLPMSPADSHVFAHSRNSSINSRSSQIAEAGCFTSRPESVTNSLQMSSQLKTRLSYAMVKVQNGWQDQSLSQLEHIASQQGSPVSATSEKKRPFDMSPGHEARFPQASARAFPASSDHHMTTSPRKQISPQQRYSQISGEPPGSASSSQASTYEAFWREHSNSNVSRLPLSQSNSLAGPSLAPPVDIQSRNQWRQGPGPARQPPSLQIGSLSGAPSTPQRRPHTATRTPSQQAAVEKDAVETLLFMSSPGNSGYHQYASASTTTPLRTTMIPDHQPSMDGQSQSQPVIADTRQQESSMALRPGKTTLSGRDIDMMLDQISDGSSDDDD